MKRLAIPIVALLASNSGMSQQVANITANYSEGVAQDDASYILRACVPVPPGTMLTAPGATTSLRIADSNGDLIDDTQVEIVSRYADAADGAATVELLARVTHDGAATQYTDFEVHQVAASTTTKPVPASNSIADVLFGPDGPASAAIVGDLLNNPNDKKTIAVVAVDPLGTKYYSYPLVAGTNKREVHRYGPYVSTLRTYGVMKTTGNAGAGGANGESGPPEFPHMFGVHSYISTREGESTVGFDLRISNGFDGRSQATTIDDHMGEVYFRGIYFLVDQDLVNAAGWEPQTMVSDPNGLQVDASGRTASVPMTLFGRRYRAFPIVQPLADTDQVHWMPDAGRFQRWMVLAPHIDRAAAREVVGQKGLGFVTKQGGLWSWFSDVTPNFRNLGLRIPSLQGYSFSGSGSAKDIDDVRDALEEFWFETSSEVAVPGSFNNADPGMSMVSDVALGWARPIGPLASNGPSGNEIVYFRGERSAATASVEGVKWLMLRHRRLMEREPLAFYSRFGQPTQLYDWLDEANADCQSCPTDTELGVDIDGDVNLDTKVYTQRLYHSTNSVPDDFHYDQDASTWLQNAVVLDPQVAPFPPDYTSMGQNPNAGNENRLDQWQRTDPAHVVRMIMSAAGAAWLNNDPLCKDDLKLEAAMRRLQLQDVPDTKTKPLCITSNTLAGQLRTFASNFPGGGTALGRSYGWTATALGLAYSIGSDQERDDLLHWFTLLSSVIDDCAAIGDDMNFPVDPASTMHDTTFEILTSDIGQAQSDPMNPGCPPVHCLHGSFNRKPWMDAVLLHGMRCIANNVFLSGSTQQIDLMKHYRAAARGLVAPVNWLAGMQANFAGDQDIDWLPTVNIPEKFTWDSTCNYGYPGPELSSLGFTPFVIDTVGRRAAHNNPEYCNIGNGANYYLDAFQGGYEETGHPLFLYRSLSYFSSANPPACPGLSPLECELFHGLLENENCDPSSDDIGANRTWPNIALMLAYLEH